MRELCSRRHVGAGGGILQSQLMEGSNVATPERRDQREPPSTREAGGNETARNRPRVISDQEPQHDSPPRQQATGWLRRHPSIAFATFAVGAILVAGCVMWWLHARNYESTDDAFIDARNVSVSFQVVGAITEVPVTDNQLVPTGGLLVQIDPRDYHAAVEEAKAQVDQAKTAVANLDAQIEAQKARIDQAEKQVVQTQAALTFAHQENGRARDLVKRGAGTEQAAQQMRSNLIQAGAGMASAEANAVAAKKQIPVLEASD